MSTELPEKCSTSAQLRLWGVVVSYFAIAQILFLLAGLRIPLGEQLVNFAAITAPTCWLIAFRGRLPDSRFIEIFAGLVQYLLACAATVLLSFAAARLNAPLRDEDMLAFDRALGYDWRIATQWMADHRVFATFVGQAYLSIGWQPILIMTSLTLTGQSERRDRFVLATVLGLIATVGVFALFPVTTAWVHLGLPEAQERALRLGPVSHRVWVAKLMALREAADMVSVRTNFALIGFPSFHTLSGILNVWALWTVKRARLPMLALNGLLIAGTPFMGGHYIADLVAGAGVAGLCMALSARLWRPAPARAFAQIASAA